MGHTHPSGVPLLGDDDRGLAALFGAIEGVWMNVVVTQDAGIIFNGGTTFDVLSWRYFGQMRGGEREKKDCKNLGLWVR